VSVLSCVGVLCTELCWCTVYFVLVYCVLSCVGVLCTELCTGVLCTELCTVGVYVLVYCVLCVMGENFIFK